MPSTPPLHITERGRAVALAQATFRLVRHYYAGLPLINQFKGTLPVEMKNRLHLTFCRIIIADTIGEYFIQQFKIVSLQLPVSENTLRQGETSPVMMEQKVRRTIGLLIPNIHNEYMTGIWKGVIRGAEEHDINLLIFRGEAIKDPYGDGYQNNVIYDLIKPDNIDGIILASGALCNFISRKEFQDFCTRFKNIPMVSLSIEFPDIPSILTDNKSGIMHAVDHLVETHGYEKIAFIRGPENNDEAEVRYRTFLERMQHHGRQVDPELVVTGNFLAFSGAEGVKTLLDSRNTKFEAILASNDDMAFGALGELQKRGLRVPQDIAIIGFDNVETSEFMVPSLTTIQQPLFEQCVLAVNTLCRIIQGEKVEPTQILSTELVTRLSCGCLPHSINKFRITDKTGTCSEKSPDIPETAPAMLQEQLLSLYRKGGANFITIEAAAQDVEDVFTLLHSQFSPESMDRYYQKWMSRGLDFIRHGVDLSLGHNLLLFVMKYCESIDPDLICSSGYTRFITSIRAILFELENIEQENRRNEQKRLYYSVSFNIQEIVTSVDQVSLADNIYLELERLGIHSCYIVVYKNIIKYYKNDTWKYPDEGQLMLACYDGAYFKSDFNAHIDIKTMIPSRYLPQGRRFTGLFRPMCFSENQYGYILVELNIQDGNFYNFLHLQISSTYRSIMLYRDQKNTANELKSVLNELESANKQLYSLSETDELTKVYNRRGFMEVAERQRRLCSRSGYNGILMYIDLDGLKKINDTYGHKEGDEAILALCTILKKSFRTADSIGRLGGDEFAVITINVDERFIANIRVRLNQEFEAHNEASKKSYTLAMSMGVCAFTNEDERTLEELMQEADASLYQIKKAKKRGCNFYE